MVRKCWRNLFLSCDETGDGTDKSKPSVQKLGSLRARASMGVCAGPAECSDLAMCCGIFCPSFLLTAKHRAVVVLQGSPLCSSKVKCVFLVVFVASLPQNSLERAVSWSPGPPEPAFHSLLLLLKPQWGIMEHNRPWMC